MKYKSSDTIRSSRERLGWDQAELAQRLGGVVRQQAISGWERGISRPKREIVSTLAKILNVSTDTLMEDCGYKLTAPEKANDLILPVRPLSTTLPLAGFSFEQFEQFCADLVGYLCAPKTSHRWGGPGHKQDGIDIVIQDKSTISATFQCKREKEFGPKKLIKAINKVKVQASEHFILLSRTASPAIRDEIKNHSNWDIWDVEDISRKVRSLYSSSPGSAINLVDIHLPGWRENFLGVSEPGSWIKAQDFFKRFEGDRVFTHFWKYVGRQNILDEARTFLSTAEHSVSIISGRGGTGKTRLLREISTIAEKESGFQVRFLALGQDPTPRSYELLPKDKNLLIIIDDAHERSNVAGIISGVSQIRPNAKFLLSLRPYGFSQLAYELSRAGLYLSELKTWNLGDLKISEAEKLARDVAGIDAREIDIQRIARLTNDCPFITVIASGLIKRGKLNATILEGDDSIRKILLEYKNAIISPLQSNVDTLSSLLNAISLIQPIQITSDNFKTSLSTITGRPFDELMPYIRKLEDGGILMRRGQALRIVPDLLGDVILAEACFDDRSRTGSSTGYIERVYKLLNELPLQHLVINLSRVDWQINYQKKQQSNLVDIVWKGIEKEFRESGIRGRRQIIDLVNKISYFQPGRAFSLAKWAIDNPTNELEKIEGIFAKINPPSYQDVLNEIPTSLKHIAYNMDYLPEAANLLWRLAQNDKRKTNPFPEHPLRVLQDLASYQIGKPIEFNNMIIDSCEQWLKENSNNLYSPFDVLECLLATEGSDDFSEGFTISFRPYPINLSAVQELRARVNELAFLQAKSTDIKSATRAIKAIGAGLHYPHGLFGRIISKKETDNWTPIFVKTIDRLVNLTKDKNLDPVINVSIRGILIWHRNYSKTATKKAAEVIFNTSSNLLEMETALAIHDGWGRLFKHLNDYDKAELMKQKWFEDIAKKIIAQRSDEEAVNLIEERIDKQLQIHGEKGNPGPFVWTVVRLKASIGEKICQRIISNSQTSLKTILPIVLAQLVESKPKEALVLSKELIKLNNVSLARSVSQAFGWNRGLRKTLIDGEKELLDSLVIHEDEFVRTSVLRAIQLIYKVNKTFAIELMSKIRFEDSRDVAEEYFSILESSDFIKWKDLSKSHCDNIWDQLLACPSLDDHFISKFLAEASAVDPDSVLRLLKNRVENDEKHHDSEKFQAIPYHWQHCLQFHGHPHFTQLLKEIRNWIADKPSSWQRSKMGSEIFVAVAGGFNDDVIEVLGEGICSGSKNQLNASLAILRETPRNLVWENVEFVVRVLHEALKFDEKTLQQASGSLYASVISGVRTGTPGQPFSEDIEQRDKSSKILAMLPPGSVETKFYRSLEESAIESIKSHAEDDERHMDGRDW